MAVITISRQYGGGGDEIAAQLCERLGYRFFDKGLMSRIAADAGISAGEVVDFSEDQHRVRGLLERLFGSYPTAYSVPMVGGFDVVVAEPDEERFIVLVRKVVIAAYNQGNVVVVGRGGQMILRDQPGVLHVRIEAPTEARIERVRQELKLGLEEAHELVKQRDRAAADYVRRFYKVDPAEPLLYHLVINTGMFQLPAAVDLVARAVAHLPMPPESEVQGAWT